jgi:hypothetical protein
VGAAIAAGNQLENGICALFVMAAKVIAKIWYIFSSNTHMCKIFQCPWFSVHAMARSSITSPIRLVRAVTIPAANDFGF